MMIIIIIILIETLIMHPHVCFTGSPPLSVAQHISTFPSPATITSPISLHALVI